MNDVSRFVEMYEKYYPQVEEELRGGLKEGHWMWFIFPQLKGLGKSTMSVYYGIADLEEARAFLASPCGEKMQRLLGILLNLENNDAEEVFGHVDALKLASSMTLFSVAAPDNPLFQQVLDKFYGGQKDDNTMKILETQVLMTRNIKDAATGDGGKKEARTTPEDLFDRLKGMFWGLVVGDCLGSPIQFSPKDDHPFITEMVPCRIFNTPKGYWTDDSSMAFCVAESAVRLGRYDIEDIANNFVRWYDNGFWSSLPYAFDVGNATIAAINGIKQGSLQNGKEESQGNGSIMRFAPSYIMNYGRPDNRMMQEISGLTHFSSIISQTIDRMARICDEHILGLRTSDKSIYCTRGDVNNSGWAVSTLEAALWAFETTDTFEKGMVAAVNLGGDSDSIGAVHGQIAGAYYGFNAIPTRWLEAVHRRDDINALIEKLIRMNIERLGLSLH